jgi:two-component system LytT family response regulator
MIKTIIVDDEADSRELIKSILVAECANTVSVVAEAYDVKTGINEIEKNNPDIVFLDVNLPDGDGFDILKHFNEINFKIIFGVTSTFKDPIDFIKKNRALFTAVTKEITNIIVQYLMAIAMREISKLAGNAAVIKLKEKVDNKKQQLISLLGVPQDAIRKIKGLI